MAEYDLKKAINKIGSGRLNFALFRGKKDNQVVIAQKAPEKTAPEDVAKDCGAETKRVIKGICYYDAQDRLVFASKQDTTTTLEHEINTVFKDHGCQTLLPIVFLKLGANESDEVGPPAPGQSPAPGASGAQASPAPGAQASPAPGTQASPAPGAQPAPPPGTQATSNPAPPAQTPPPAAPPGEAPLSPDAAFAARLRALKPAIEQAIAANDATSEKVKAGFAEVAGFARQKDFVQAGAKLDGVEKLLQPANSQAQLAEFAARLKKITPAIVELVKTNSPVGEQAKQLATAAGGQAKSLNFPKANELLGQAEDLVRKAGASGQTAPPAPGVQPATSGEQANREVEWHALFGRMEADYLQAVKAGSLTPEAEKLQSRIKVMWAYATAQSETGAFDKAITTLQNLEKEGLFAQLAQAKAGGSGIPTGIVEKRKYLLDRWQKIPGELQAELAKLQQGVAKDVPTEDAADLGGELDDYLMYFVDEIQDEIDTAIQKGDPSVMKGLKSRVMADPIVAHLVENPFMSGTKFKSLMTDALDELETAMTK